MNINCKVVITKIMKKAKKKMLFVKLEIRLNKAVEK